MKKKLICLAAALVLMVPAFAVLSEKDLAHTLSVLRYELRSTYRTNAEFAQRMQGRGERQHARLVKMMQQSNELSLMLYSQKQDYTFDMTYALNEVSKQYEDFSSRKMPFDEIVQRLDIDIDRYDRLVHTLRSLPPSMVMEYVDSSGRVVYLDAEAPKGQRRSADLPPVPESGFELDSIGRLDRDSCLFYAQALLDISQAQKAALVRDSTHYQQTADMLKSAYDYAQQRYKNVQTKIFIDGQTDYVTLMKGFRRYWRQAVSDANDKYSLKTMGEVHSQWRGPMVVGFGVFALFYLLVSIVLSIGIVAVLLRKVPFFRRDAFQNNRFAMTLITTVILFATSIMIAGAVSAQHFFSMASSLLIEFAWMLAAILVSLVIRYKGDSVKVGVGLYTPVLLTCFLIIAFRIAFIPNSMLNFIFPPMLLVFTVIQLLVLLRSGKKVRSGDKIFGWISLLVMFVTTVIAFRGYVLLGVQLLIWWFFFLTLLQTITAVYDLLDIFYRNHIRESRQKYIAAHPNMPHRTDEDLIAVTWFHSLAKKALLPIGIVLSLPLSFYMASGVFDLKEIFMEYYVYPFLQVEGYISLSLSKLIYVITLYFVFGYLNYLAKALYRRYKISEALKKSPSKVLVETDFNFTLAGNVIGITLWGIYVITLFVMLRIPTTAVKVVGAGLATGLGFAMKDILNNFFYGVQLMSGRLRVGDSVECDGIRGKVDSISYQSTSIIAADGSVMAFPNATLFNKNFKNLTRNHSYELLDFMVGVKYGSDVEEVRSIILESLKPLCVTDKYGREIVDPKFGIQVRFKNFGDSSVDLQVVLFTTVDEHYTFAARAKEAIYNALNAHGIEIPFPQRDLYLKAMPDGNETE